jgi:hypothetical protein
MRPRAWVKEATIRRARLECSESLTRITVCLCRLLHAPIELRTETRGLWARRRGRDDKERYVALQYRGGDKVRGVMNVCVRKMNDDYNNRFRFMGVHTTELKLSMYRYR